MGFTTFLLRRTLAVVRVRAESGAEMFKSLDGQTVIVTGASKGIGKGIAKCFADAGANVLVVSRHLAEAETAAAADRPESLRICGRRHKPRGLRRDGANRAGPAWRP